MGSDNLMVSSGTLSSLLLNRLVKVTQIKSRKYEIRLPAYHCLTGGAMAIEIKCQMLSLTRA